MWAFTTNQSEPERYYQDPWTALQNALPDAQYIWKDGECRHTNMMFIRFNAKTLSIIFEMTDDRENIDQALNWSLVHPQTARSVLGVARHSANAMKDWTDTWVKLEFRNRAIEAFAPHKGVTDEQ